MSWRGVTSSGARSRLRPTQLTWGNPQLAQSDSKTTKKGFLRYEIHQQFCAGKTSFSPKINAKQTYLRKWVFSFFRYETHTAPGQPHWRGKTKFLLGTGRGNSFLPCSPFLHVWARKNKEEKKEDWQLAKNSSFPIQPKRLDKQKMGCPCQMSFFSKNGEYSWNNMLRAFACFSRFPVLSGGGCGFYSFSFSVRQSWMGEVFISDWLRLNLTLPSSLGAAGEGFDNIWTRYCLL